MKVRHMAAVNNSGGGIREQSETGETKKASEMLRKGGKYKGGGLTLSACLCPAEVEAQVPDSTTCLLDEVRSSNRSVFTESVNDKNHQQS